MEIIVVDNASGDDSVERIGAAHPNIRLIKADDNCGFAAGNDLGLEHARGRAILLLNPDTRVRPGVLDRVFDTLSQQPDVGVVGVGQIGDDGRVHSSAMRFLRPRHFLLLAFFGQAVTYRFRWLVGLRYPEQHPGTDFACDAVVGCFMAMRRSLLEAIGGLDRRIFMYGEELEFCWRARAAGYRNLHLGSVQIVHIGGASTRAHAVWRDVQMQAGQLVYMSLTQGRSAARRTAVYMILGSLLRLPIEAGLWLFGNRAALRSRLARILHATRSVSDPPRRSTRDILPMDS